MAIKYLTPDGRNGTTYSFGGGGNTVEVDPNAATTDPNTSLYYGYTVSLGGGDDLATLGLGNDTVYGDLGSDTIAGGSGNDALFGGIDGVTTSRKLNTDTLYGDFAGTVSDSSGNVLGADTLKGASGSANFTNYLYGDAYTLSGTAIGAGDVLVGGDLARNFMYGDAQTLTGNATGGNDNLTAGSGADNHLYGDAGSVNGAALLGNDTLTGASGASNIMYGDASSITRTVDVAASGNDILIGGTGAGTGNAMYGDASLLMANGGAITTAGDDTLIGGDGAFNTLYGDAQDLIAEITDSVVSQVTGGNDTLFAGNGGTNTLYGDSQYQQGNVIGGDDILTSGTGNDTMWGDVSAIRGIAPGTIVGGADTFVFMQNSGADVIKDFRIGDGDLIDLRDYGFTDWSTFSTQITNNGTNTYINLGGTNQITVSGVVGLGESSFLLA